MHAGHSTSRRPAAASLSLSALLSSLGTSIANVGLPALSSAFEAPFSQVQWVSLAYLLAMTASIAIVGRVGDLLGRRRLLVLGVLVFTGASAVCGVAPSLPALVAARALQGLGAANMLALSAAIMRETVPTERIGRAMGLLGSTSAVGTALGPVLGGLLIAHVHWRALFLVLVPCGALTLWLAYRHLPTDPPTPGATSVGWQQQPNLLRDPCLRAGLVANASVATVMMTTLVVGPFYLIDALQLDVATVGVVMSVGPIIAAMSGVPAGRLADRYGTSRVLIVGLVGVAVGSLALATMPVTLGVAGYVVPIIVMTTSYALFQTANSAALLARTGPRHPGAVSGMLNLSRNVGFIAGSSGMAAIFALASGHGVSAALRSTFVVAAMLGALALAVTIRRFQAPQCSHPQAHP